ncbi:prepilin peptidase [Carnobacterium divergens]|uniref:prepilin peptidase n=1 Tax=Carnobacterium divergens TaxID=2748 RepID=UPI00128DB543|nr:A24 family peptidase [Carnobacterium divergens]MPQ22811.1 prepilin peptidase [Carnobacterium divergens]
MLILAFLFIIGCCFGSFILVASLRIPAGESIVSPRSHCFRCKTILPIYSLIPIFSYAIQQGRCCYCKTKIPIYYLVVEIVTGCLVGGAFLLFKHQPSELLLAWTLIIFSVFFSLTDFFYLILPNSFMFLFFIIVFLECWYRMNFHFLTSAFSALLIAVVLLSIALITQEGIGGGDIKFYFVLTWILGFQGILTAIIISCLLAIVAFFIINKRNPYSLNRKLPFAPFISIGALLVFCI